MHPSIPAGPQRMSAHYKSRPATPRKRQGAPTAKQRARDHMAGAAPQRPPQRLGAWPCQGRPSALLAGRPPGARPAAARSAGPEGGEKSGSRHAFSCAAQGMVPHWALLGAGDCVSPSCGQWNCRKAVLCACDGGWRLKRGPRLEVKAHLDGGSGVQRLQGRELEAPQLPHDVIGPFGARVGWVAGKRQWAPPGGLRERRLHKPFSGLSGVRNCMAHRHS
jgi:hypothetical protein